MLFSSQLSTGRLIELCRTLRHSLAAGLTVRDVFRQLSRRGSPQVRAVAERLRRDVERGKSLQSAFDRERASFPPLFLALAGVGEQTGNLPEVFGELEKYYTLQQRLRRQFFSQSLLPVLQFVAAVAVVALLILIIGLIPGPGDGLDYDPVGLGLKGPTGAAVFVGGFVGFLAALAAGYLVATRLLHQKPAIDAALLRVPAVGACLEALALARFCLALRLTLDTGMSVLTAMRLSLAGTGNAAFVACTDAVTDSLKEGDDLGLALGRCRHFPTDFLNIVAVAEEGGRVPEVLRQQSEHYAEESERRLTILTRLAGFGVWLFVAALIIYTIFRIFLSYLEILNQFL